MSTKRTAVAVTVALLGGHAAGQVCTPEWRPGRGLPGADGGVLAFAPWDPDGPGPNNAQLIVGGDFGTLDGKPIRALASWDGAEWSAVSGVFDGPVQTMKLWDPDAGGPLTTRLVVAGVFDKIGGLTVNKVAQWDGTTWSAFGAGFTDAIKTVCVWDPDGQGPSPHQLVVGGPTINMSGTTMINGIARWTGTAWQPVGGGIQGGSINSVTTWDPDGAGPLAELLIAGGNFITSAGAPANYIAAWNGVSWSPLGTGMGPNFGGGSSVGVVNTWDPDGPGPAPRVLCAGGDFTTAGGNPAEHVAIWDGSSWQPLGTGLNSGVGALHEWDSDGPGPALPKLIAGGGFSAAGTTTAHFIAQWDGAFWAEVPPGLDSNVGAFGSWDPDGDGPRPTLLMVAGAFDQLWNGPTVNHVASWDGETWAPLGQGINFRVWGLAPFDTDGSGPAPQMLAAIGQFDTAGGLILEHVGLWDGQAWSAAGSPSLVNGWPRKVFGWTAPNGSGELVMGGEFTSVGGVSASRIARWDGASWSSFGGGMNNIVKCFTAWDPDGPGPMPMHLIAGGAFTSADGVAANRVARWDGSAWHALGVGVGAEARALATWDPDGNGPSPDLLVVGGLFSTAGGGTVNRIASWNGAQWSAFGVGIVGQSVASLASFDADGPGPASPQLIAAGSFSGAGGVPASNIASWDGVGWSALKEGLTASFGVFVPALAVHDFDGGGPDLFAAGNFTSAGGNPMSGLARWDGSAWHAVGAGIDGTGDSLQVFDPDEGGPGPEVLVVGGLFGKAGSQPSAHFAVWGCPAPPPCYPDCTGDGALTVGDFGCFQTAFVAGDPYADCNEDGSLTVADFGCFQTKFVAGCP